MASRDRPHPDPLVRHYQQLPRLSGRLSHQVYRDDCLFVSPDPDLPIRGLPKYLGVATHLFDAKQSSAELLDLRILDDNAIQANWRMSMTIKLPWRPHLPTFTGTTTYRLDRDHLIYSHIETWNLAVSEAFFALFVDRKEDDDTTRNNSGGCPFARFFSDW